MPFAWTQLTGELKSTVSHGVLLDFNPWVKGLQEHRNAGRNGNGRMEDVAFGKIDMFWCLVMSPGEIQLLTREQAIDTSSLLWSSESLFPSVSHPDGQSHCFFYSSELPVP